MITQTPLHTYLCPVACPQTYVSEVDTFRGTLGSAVHASCPALSQCCPGEYYLLQHSWQTGRLVVVADLQAPSAHGASLQCMPSLWYCVELTSRCLTSMRLQPRLSAQRLAVNGAGDVRLVGGETAADGGAQYGRLEIFDGSVWGGVCDTSITIEFDVSPRTFTDGSAVVACRQLGFADGIVAALSVRPHPFQPPPPSHHCSPDLVPENADRRGDLRDQDMQTCTWGLGILLAGPRGCATLA